MVSNLKMGSRRALKEAQDEIKDDDTLDYNITIEDIIEDQSHQVKISSDRLLTSAISHNVRSYNCSPNHSPSKINGSAAHHCKIFSSQTTNR